MAKGNNIIVTGEPKGVRMEGIIATALYPGTVVMITGFSNDVFTFDTWNYDADGDRREVIVLLEDRLQGGLATTQYSAGARCFCYVPLPGEELNMLIENISGTADSHAILELLMVNDGSGKLIATTGSPESEPFRLLETLAALTADTLAHCLYTGY